LIGNKYLAPSGLIYSDQLPNGNISKNASEYSDYGWWQAGCELVYSKNVE